MQATVQGRVYTGPSWAAVVAAAIEGEGSPRTYSGERRDAARAMARGVSVFIGGFLLKPEGARE